jgi:predicted membrane protein
MKEHPQKFKDILLLIGIIIILLRLNRELALVSFTVLPLIFITTLFFSHRARDAFREIRSKIALIHDALIMGIKNYFEKLGLKKAIIEYLDSHRHAPWPPSPRMAAPTLASCHTLTRGWKSTS